MKIHPDESEIALTKLKDPNNFKHQGEVNLYIEPACTEEHFLNSIP